MAKSFILSPTLPGTVLGYTEECDTKAPGFMELSRMRETVHKQACDLLSWDCPKPSGFFSVGTVVMETS